MRWMKLLLAFTLLLAAADHGYMVPAAAGAELAEFRFLKDLDRGAAGEEQIVAFTLDAEIYAATRDGLPDLRVFNSQDAESPYLLEPVTETRRERVQRICGSRAASLEEKDGRIEILLRLDKDAPPAEGLTIFTPLQDYQRRVQVFGSNDEGASWKPLVADALIFDYARFMDLRNSEIALPGNRDRLFKVVVDNVTDQQQSSLSELTRKYREGREKERTEKTVVERRPLRIDHIEFWGHAWEDRGQQAKKTDYPVDRFEVEQRPKEKMTVVEVRIRREPLTSLTLETSSRNFSRRAEVQVSRTQGETSAWVTVGGGTVQLLDFRGYHRSQLTVGFPQQRQERYRLVLHDEDNPPLEITGVKAAGDVYRALFLAQEGKTYRAAYGSPGVETPHYDTLAVLGPLRAGNQAVEAKLGPQLDNQAFRADHAPRRNWLNHPAVLVGAIVLMVGVLGWALYRAGRRIEQIPDE